MFDHVEFQNIRETEIGRVEYRKSKIRSDQPDREQTVHRRTNQGEGNPKKAGTS